MPKQSRQLFFLRNAAPRIPIPIHLKAQPRLHMFSKQMPSMILCRKSLRSSSTPTRFALPTEVLSQQELPNVREQEFRVEGLGGCVDDLTWLLALWDPLLQQEGTVDTKRTSSAVDPCLQEPQNMATQLAQQAQYHAAM